MTAIPVDLPRARAALAELTPRTAALVASIDAPARPTTGLEWTLAETAAHLLIGLRGYTDALQGEVGRWTHRIPESAGYRDRLGGMTSSTLADEPSRDPSVLSRRLVSAADAFLEASAGRSADEPLPTPGYAPGASLSLGVATSLLFGEQVIHGWDIARTLGTPWPVTREQALLLLPAFEAMMPLAVDPGATRGVHAVFALHVRGASGFVLRVDDGRAEVEPLRGERRPCPPSGDAVSLAMVGYGRISQWRAIGRGGLFAWGRRPWMGVRMIGMFYNP